MQRKKNQMVNLVNKLMQDVLVLGAYDILADEQFTLELTIEQKPHHHSIQQCHSFANARHCKDLLF